MGLGGFGLERLFLDRHESLLSWTTVSLRARPVPFFGEPILRQRNGLDERLDSSATERLKINPPW